MVLIWVLCCFGVLEVIEMLVFLFGIIGDVLVDYCVIVVVVVWLLYGELMIFGFEVWYEILCEIDVVCDWVLVVVDVFFDCIVLVVCG